MIKKGLLYSAPVLALIAALTAYGWFVIEPGDLMPVHFNIDGEADGYMQKEKYLLLHAGLAFGLTAFFAFLPLISPRRDNLYKSAAFYLSGWVGVLIILAGVEAVVLHAALTGASPSMKVVSLPVAALLIVIGNFMAKTRSNWIAGVRTMWTLSSEHAWKAANRTTGWLFVLAGLASIAATFFITEKTGLIVLLAGALTAGFAGVIVSYFAWRADPERHGANGDS